MHMHLWRSTFVFVVVLINVSRLTSATSADESQVIKLGHLILEYGSAVAKFATRVFLISCSDLNDGSIADFAQHDHFESDRQRFIGSPMRGQSRTNQTRTTSPDQFSRMVFHHFVQQPLSRPGNGVSIAWSTTWIGWWCRSWCHSSIWGYQLRESYSFSSVGEVTSKFMEARLFMSVVGMLSSIPVTQRRGQNHGGLSLIKRWKRDRMRDEPSSSWLWCQNRDIKGSEDWKKKHDHK